MDQKYIIGVDIGGTWVRVGFMNLDEKTFLKKKERIDTSSNVAIAKQVVSMIRNLGQKFNASLASMEGVGIASAGPLDAKRGILIKPTNLPFEQVPLVEPVREEFRVPVILVNDCSAGVLGEWKFGNGKGVNNLFYVALGTGIGGGAIVDGHLLLGKDGNAAEIGHFIIDYEGKLTCGCGKRGHWEAYCSGINIPKFVDTKLKEMTLSQFRNSPILGKNYQIPQFTSEMLFNAAKREDSLSLLLVEEIGLLNAIGFANVINAYDPSLISIGGTIALRNPELVLNPIKKNVSNYSINRIPEIIITSLGEDIGILGGISAVLNQADK